MIETPLFRYLRTVDRTRIPPNDVGDIRLHRGERVEPLPSRVLDQMRASYRPSLIQQYPHYAPFIERLAAFEGLPRDHLLLGAGIEEFIRTLMLLACQGVNRKVAVSWPTCAMYGVYAKALGIDLTRIVTEREYWSASEVIDQLDDIRLLFLVNPSQPIDVCLNTDELFEIALECEARGILLAIDEAYFGFGALTGKELITEQEFENVLVMRTFSKAFGAAGIRVGYAMGHPHLIKALDAVRPSGEIAGPSMQIATTLLNMWDDHIAPAVQEICQARDWLREGLIDMGYVAHGSYTNHVLVAMPSPQAAEHIAARLATNFAFYVKAGLPEPAHSHLLVTCGSMPVMREFMDAFRPLDAFRVAVA